jgi:5-methylcytosine-specific restriction endonuclease McrBC regulatory subunit McrC
MLELREQQTRTVELLAEQAAELSYWARGTPGGADGPRVIERLTPADRAGWYHVQPGPYVGRFTLASGLTVDIASRLPMAALLEILRVATREPSLLRDRPVPNVGGHGLVDLIAAAFSRELERLIGVGIAKGYQARHFTRPPYPGVPDVTLHLARHLGRPDRLITRAQRLTADIPVNQVLAAALATLRAQHYVDDTRPVRLRALTPAFAHITTPAHPARTADAVRRQVPRRYRDGFALAELILGGQTTLPVGSGTIGPTVLFSMWGLWEAYVQARLERELPAGHRFSRQHPVLLTDDISAMTAKADLVELDQRGQPISIVDAKYKQWQATPATPDLYQVITYAQRLRLGGATLVYPGAGEHSEVVVGPYRIAMRGLDVLKDPQDSTVAEPRPV